MIRTSTGEFVLECWSGDGVFVSNKALTPWLKKIADPVESVAILALGPCVWVALGQHLFRCNGDHRKPRHWRCESPILGLEPSAPFLPRAAVARCARGAAVFWFDQPGGDPEMLAADLVKPLATFLRNGTLVLLSSTESPGGFAGQVIDLDRRGVHGTTDFTWSGERPVALIATDAPGSFAIFTHTGEVTVYQIPAAK